MLAAGRRRVGPFANVSQGALIMTDNGITGPPPSPGRRAGGLALIILGLLVMIGTAVACIAYGLSHMKGLGPLEKATLKQNVRAAGTIPMLAGAGLLAVGWRMRKSPRS